MSTSPKRRRYSRTPAASTQRRHAAADLALSGQLQAWLDLHAAEVGECLEWRGKVNRISGVPVIRMPRALPMQPGNQLDVVYVARAVWETHHRRAKPQGRMIARTCGNLRCIGVQHLRPMTQLEIGRVMAKLGKCRMSIKQRTKLSIAARGRSVVDVEQVRALRARAAEVPTGKRRGFYTAEAKALGLSPSNVAKIVRGATWAESNVPSPFAGLFTSLVAPANDGKRRAAA